MNSLAKLPVTSTLTGATIQTAERNEFSNTGRDTIKITVQNILDRQTVTTESEQNSGENTAEDNKDLQSVSALGGNPGFYTIISTVLAAIFGQRKIQSPMGVDERTCSNPADQDASTYLASGHDFEPAAIISDIPAHINFSSSSPSITTERYTRSMLDCQCTAGYPLYEPRPDSEPSTEYWKKGVRIGDVGIVTEDGVFDFLFNVCPSQNPSINPSELPDDFEPLECPEIRVIGQHLEMQTHLFSKTVNRVEEPDVRYKCLGHEGAILELPAGATLFDVKNKDTFKRLASRHAEQWYRYLIVTRGRDAPNGSLYLVTSCIKCTHWGIALFDRPSASQDYLQFIENEVHINTNQNLRSKYRWTGLGAFISKATRDSDIPRTSDGDSQNQCVFLRGYKIMLRKDVWDNAIDPDFAGTPYMTTFDTSAPNQTSNQTRHGGSSSNQNNYTCHEGEGSLHSDGPTDEGTLFMTSSQIGSERVIVQADFNSSPLHPSDFINTVLLSQEPDAKAALTHDDDWWNFMQDYNDLAKITSSYTSVIDEYGSVSLEFAGRNNQMTSISTSLVAPIPLRQLPNVGHAQPHNAVNSEIMPTLEDGEELKGPPIYHGDEDVKSRDGDNHQLNNMGGSRGFENFVNFVSFEAIDDSSTPDLDHQINRVIHEKTLKRLQDWTDSPIENERIVWLHGPAGTGKTVLALEIARTRQERVAGTFFFYRLDATRNDVMHLFPTLAWQLAATIPDMKAHIIHSINHHHFLSIENIEKQFEHLVVRPFAAMRTVSAGQPFDLVVIIDGVDECINIQLQQKFLRVIGNAIRDRLVPLRFIISSKPEAHIQETFNQFECPVLQIDLAGFLPAQELEKEEETMPMLQDLERREAGEFAEIKTQVKGEFSLENTSPELKENEHKMKAEGGILKINEVSRKMLKRTMSEETMPKALIADLRKKKENKVRKTENKRWKEWEEREERWKEREERRREKEESWRMMGESWREMGESWREMEKSRREMEESRREMEESWREKEESWRETEDSWREMEDSWREMEENQSKMEEGRREMEEGRREMEESQKKMEERWRETKERYRKAEESHDEAGVRWKKAVGTRKF